MHTVVHDDHNRELGMFAVTGPALGFLPAAKVTFMRIQWRRGMPVAGREGFAGTQPVPVLHLGEHRRQIVAFQGALAPSRPDLIRPRQIATQPGSSAAGIGRAIP